MGFLDVEFGFREEILKNSFFVGELALDGNLRPVSSILPSVIFAKEQGFARIFLPEENTPEASLIPGIDIVGVKNLSTLTNMLSGATEIKPAQHLDISEMLEKIPSHEKVDFSHILGQDHAKRALLVAASG